MAEVDGEKLICRTIRLITQISPNSEIIVTSHNPNYEFKNCRRYEPKNNVLEIDRFTEELIEDNVCFLYGDTFYTQNSMEKIIKTEGSGTLFFGNSKSIVAVKVFDSDEFRFHVNRVRNLFLEGKIKSCKGWQVYQSFQNQDMRSLPLITDEFILLDNETTDINTPEDYNKLV